MIKYATGLIKSPDDPRDWHYTRVVQSAPLPDNVSMEHLCHESADQGAYGFCYAFAAATVKTVQEAQETGRVMRFSPLDIAREVKAIDGRPDTEGSDNKSTCKIICESGAVLEDFYPYTGYTGGLKFPELKNADRLPRFKAANYARCDTLTDIKQALAARKPVLLGLMVGDNFFALAGGSGDMADLPFNTALFGHDVVAVGYDSNKTGTFGNRAYKGFIRIQNSWGTDWGDNGFCWIPEAYITFKSDMGMLFFLDAYAFVDLENDNLNGEAIELFIDGRAAYINGQEIILDQPAIIDPSTSRTLVPARFISEALGHEVLWDGKNNRVVVLK